MPVLVHAESRWFERGVIEAIHIRMERPSLNKAGDRYNLPSIWNMCRDRQHRGKHQGPTDDQSIGQSLLESS